jgi:hypothetical protein
VLGCLPPLEATPRVIAIDDLEVSAGQELFGRWHRHLWRLGAQWVAIGGGDDPTPYLDAGADDWWVDGILPVPALGAAEARELVLRRLHAAGVECPCPDQLIAAARGNPRDVIRRVRSLLLSEMGSRAAAWLHRPLHAALYGRSQRAVPVRPAFPPRPPSAAAGGTFPITTSIHARAPTRDLSNNAGPSS